MNNNETEKNDAYSDGLEHQDLPIAYESHSRVEQPPVQINPANYAGPVSPPTDRQSATNIGLWVIVLVVLIGSSFALYFVVRPFGQNPKQDVLEKARERNQDYEEFNSKLVKLRGSLYQNDADLAIEEAGRSSVLEFLQRLKAGANSKDNAALATLFETDTLLKSLNYSQTIIGQPGTGQHTFRLRLLQYFRSGSTELIDVFDCSEIQLCKTRRIELYAVAELRLHYNRDAPPVRARLWLVHDNDQWKFFNFEVHDSGYEFADVVRNALQPDSFTQQGSPAKVTIYERNAIALKKTNSALSEGHFRRATRYLDQANFAKMPNNQKGMYCIAKARILLAKERYNDALTELRKIPAYKFDSAVQYLLLAKAQYGLGEFQSAIGYCENYQKFVGND